MIETATAPPKTHVMTGIAPKLEIKTVYYHSLVFRKAKNVPGISELRCIICGFSLDNNQTIDVLDGKGKKHIIHYEHILVMDEKDKKYATS